MQARVPRVSNRSGVGITEEPTGAYEKDQQYYTQYNDLLIVRGNERRPRLLRNSNYNPSYQRALVAPEAANRGRCKAFY